MKTVIINGREIARQIEAGVAEKIRHVSFKPVLYDIIVGGDPVSEQFVEVKRRAAQRVGFGFEVGHFELAASSSSIIEFINELNDRKEVLGIIVQLPLPFGEEDNLEILDAIAFEKDVDCLSKNCRNLFYTGSVNAFVPPVAKAVVRILESVPGGISRSSKYLLLGQGPLVGRPTREILSRLGLEVNLADKNTPLDILNTLLSSADIVISAIGQAGFIKGNMIKPGAIIIDCGTSENKGVIKGDVDKDSVVATASYLSPVPGGVGPVAVAELLFSAILFIK